jgi:hypothetical protein
MQNHLVQLKKGSMKNVFKNAMNLHPPSENEEFDDLSISSQGRLSKGKPRDKGFNGGSYSL